MPVIPFLNIFLIVINKCTQNELTEVAKYTPFKNLLPTVT